MSLPRGWLRLVGDGQSTVARLTKLKIANIGAEVIANGGVVGKGADCDKRQSAHHHLQVLKYSASAKRRSPSEGLI